MSTALVTGTSTGIGLATALTLGRAGHRVFAGMRNPGKAPQLGRQVAEEGLPVQIVTMDVDSDESVRAAVDHVTAQAGPVDVLINNAGIERTGSVEDLPQEEFRATMETNYFGPLRCIKAVLPSMRQRRGGCIINVTSVGGKLALSPFAAYSASKFALEALSEMLAQEVKPFNVHVAIVEPGIINTPMARRIEESKHPTVYPQRRRMAALFAAALENPTAPSVVADKILEIVDSGTWKLRHPVGPGAQGFLDWRAAMGDEECVDFGALDDDAWYDRVEADFGLDARAKA